MRFAEISAAPTATFVWTDDLTREVKNSVRARFPAASGLMRTPGLTPANLDRIEQLLDEAVDRGP